MTTADVDTRYRIERSRVSRFRGDQLVIGSAYEPLVIGKLTEWGAQPEIRPQDRDARLGLALASLRPAAAVAHLEDTDPKLVEAAKEGALAEQYDPKPLDTLVRCLRLAFAKRYGGWVPTVAKNRLLDRVQGSYVIDGGVRRQRAGGHPTPQPYVIDGGGSNDPHLLASRRVVARRAAQPGAGVRVGVLDTKVVPHPWLSGGVVADSDDLWTRDSWSSLPDTAFHATFVTGLILTQAPGATVEVQAVLDEQAQSDSWDIARAIATFGEAGFDVLNLSLGCATDDGQPPLVLTRALEVLGPGTVVVAAAGNHGTGRDGETVGPSWPAALDGVVAVGAVDGYEPAAFSPDAPWVDAMAPGVDVVSTWGVDRDGDATFADWDGTSFSAAIVSGAIAAGVKRGVDSAQAWGEVSRQSGMTVNVAGRPVPVVPMGSTVAGWPEPRDDTKE
jgi:membrane-anchored mycosin MYCP